MRHAVIASWFALILATPAFGSVVEHTYSFESPRIVAVGDYHLLGFDGTFPAGRIGEPSLPFLGAEILLPPGEAVSWIEVDKRDPVTLDASLRLAPQQPVRPLSAGSGDWVFHRTAYESETPIPAVASFPFSTHYASGLAIAVGTLCPIHYVPKTGTVTYYRAVTVRIHTEPSARSEEALGFLPASEDRLAKAAISVDNPEALALYSPKPRTRTGEYDYLIITKNTYVDDFQPLADFYNRRGIRTQIQTVEYIDANYSGTDAAERMRACISDEYQNHGIQWVLLGGDGDGAHDDPGPKVVPYRGLYSIVYSSSTYEDTHVPADCYFAGLDGNWNTDGDSRWGEPGEEDFYGEVHVGRAPVDSESEIATFITKATRYQTSPVSGEVRDVLLLGEHLWETPITWGADYMDELEGPCTNNGFTTVGFPLTCSFQKMYDKTTGWDPSDLMDAVNGGVHFVNHLGHCNTWYAMKMWDTEVTDANFTNNGINHSYCVVFTQGCLGGAFDNYYGGDWYSDDSIAEDMMTINHFAVGVIANSRYGWFTEGSTNGPSQHFHREFVDALMGEGITTLGAANTRSKDETAPFVDLPDEYEPGAHRWCFYCSNVLGDPAMDVWTDTPGTMTVSAPDEIDRNAASVEIETGVPGALVALSWDGTLYGRAYADPTGLATVVFDTSIASLNSLDLVVTAHNCLVHEDTILVTDLASVAESGSIGAQWRLSPCSPNPFSRETSIAYSIKKPSGVSIRIFDVEGRTLARIEEGAQPAGDHRVVWRPNQDVAPGIYFCEMRAGEFRAVRKMLVVK